MQVSPDSIKAWEYGYNTPRLGAFLSLCDWLRIGPTDLCRTSDDDEVEYRAGRDFAPKPEPAEERA